MKTERSLALRAVALDFVQGLAVPHHQPLGDLDERVLLEVQHLDVVELVQPRLGRWLVGIALAALAVALTLSRSISISDASSWLLIGAAVLVLGGEIRVFTVAMAAVLAVAVIVTV